MHILFNIAFFILILFYLPGFILKRKLDGDFLERLGIYNSKKIEKLNGKNVVWLHAVSVGEAAASEAFLENLRKEFPDVSFVISNTTKTGKIIANKIASSDDAVIYFPFDLSFITKKSVAKINPKIFVSVDTEIWPNMIRAFSDKNIPVILINGRISDKSFKGYSFLKSIFRSTFKRIDLACMQTSLDAERIASLGVLSDHIEITGNIKFDSALKLESDILKIKNKFKEKLGPGSSEKIFMAGSTHPGEDEIIAKVFSKLRLDEGNLKLIIAPRHIDRAGDIKTYLKKNYNYRVKLFSEITSSDAVDVIVVDKIGILKELYAFSTLVFIGGSLIKHGGQNILEPAYFAKPIIFGPYMFNFRDMSDLFLKNNAAIVVDDEPSLYLAANRLIFSEGERNALGRRARRLIDENIGATEKSVEKIKFLLKDKAISL